MKEIIVSICTTIGVLVLIVAILTLPMYYLWNWLMPDIFGLTKITLWQALGLTLLSDVIFKLSSKHK